ncbi:hypothetical protein ABBQ32_003037 [Trebouxia sp. C0010 RCD-2024]
MRPASIPQSWSRCRQVSEESSGTVRRCQICNSGSVHDTVCMRLFAAGLLAAGLKDEAAGVYYSLLQEGADRAQQAELLRQCLACWSPDLHGQPDDSTFEKLSRFVERQNTFSWGRTIDIVQDAGFGDAFALRLCEELILRDVAEDSSTSKAEWAMQKEVILKYVQISRHSLASKQQMTDAALTSLTQHFVQQQQTQQSLQQQLQEHQQASLPQSEDKQPEHSEAGRAKTPWYKRRKSVAALGWAAASLLQHDSMALRTFKVASLLCMIHDPNR